MSEPRFVGELEISRNSLYFILKELTSGKEQIYPLAEVKPEASDCHKYDLWEKALQEFDLGEVTLENTVKVQGKIESIYERIAAHRSSNCNCNESIATKYFRHLDITRKHGKLVIELTLHDNQQSGNVKYDVAINESADDFLQMIQTLLEYGSNHESFARAPIIDLTGVEHRGYDVVLAIGEMFENWHYNYYEGDDTLQPKIERMLQLIPQAIEFQEQFLKH